MDISFLHRLPEWDSIAGPWNDLLGRSVTDVPFLRHEFLRSWWTTLGGGEWTDAELWVAVGRGRDGALAAAAPLFRTAATPGTLLFVGSSEIADYLDVVAPEENVEAFARSILEAVAAQVSPGIDTLDLWNVLESSPSGSAFAGAAKDAGWSVSRERLKPCPIVGLSGGWDGYLERLDKKQRHELRRKMRRVEQTDGTAFLRAGAGIDLAEGVESFLGLMKRDPAKSRFLTPSMHALFHSLAAAGAGGGWLRLELLAAGGHAAAGAFCFDYGNQLLIYNTGMDPAYRSLSPGWALLGRLIHDAADEGKTAVDFMRGDEEYKSRLGGTPRYIERITLRRK